MGGRLGWEGGRGWAAARLVGIFVWVYLGEQGEHSLVEDCVVRLLRSLARVARRVSVKLAVPRLVVLGHDARQVGHDAPLEAAWVVALQPGGDHLLQVGRLVGSR